MSSTFFAESDCGNRGCQEGEVGVVKVIWITKVGTERGRTIPLFRESLDTIHFLQSLDRIPFVQIVPDRIPAVQIVSGYNSPRINGLCLNSSCADSLWIEFHCTDSLDKFLLYR